MLTTLERELRPSCDVRLLNLTRPANYTAGVLSLANVTRTLADIVEVFRSARDVDIVHVHSAFVPAVTIVRASLLLLAARAGGALPVLHVHGGSLPEWASTPIRRALVKLAAMPARSVVAVSDSIAEVVSHRDARTIYNGVDTAMFDPEGRVDHAIPVVIFAGLLTRRKGVVDLIDASADLRARGIEHRLVLAGGRPDEGDDEETLVRDSATGEEEFLGAVPHENMPALFKDADIFCLPSWWEAMPLSILEAMSAGLPVVATTVGQVPNIVGPDVGRLVEPKQPHALADALAELLIDGELRRELGATGRQRVLERHSVSSTVEAILGVFQDAASNRFARS